MYCTQWGYLQTGSGVPADQLPVISRTSNLNYTSIPCTKSFGIDVSQTPPDTDAINKYGGFDISYSRLAILSGEIDPWRPATPLAESQYPLTRPNTTDEPLFLIERGVHHWDENGVFPNQTAPNVPPEPVVEAQAYIASFVGEWLKEAEPVFGRTFGSY